MKRNTIKWRILKYNLVVILMLIALTTIIFNVAVRLYIERDILGQLDKIASRTEQIALRYGSGFFARLGKRAHQLPPLPPNAPKDTERFRYLLMLDRSLREPLSVLNADYILLDNHQNRITIFPDKFTNTSSKLPHQVIAAIKSSTKLDQESCLNLHLNGINYIALIKPAYQKNSFGLGWIIIYSSLAKVHQLQLGINIILFLILICSALIIVIFASVIAKKISAPFSTLNQHIRAIAARNFGAKIRIPVDDELQELVNNINAMSEKLEQYDQAQKTFLQNVSHEFRTPLMSIQSYTEGIQYGVVESNVATGIIINETRRMTRLVEDLLYLSRLDAIEEHYNFEELDFNELIHSCIERLNRIASENKLTIDYTESDSPILILADEEKLTRAITNIISNCLRYASKTVSIVLKSRKDGQIDLTIADDGPGFETDELPQIFDRFFKGKKGHFGLGLAISKTVIEKHQGKISAKNATPGALFLIELPGGTNRS